MKRLWILVVLLAFSVPALAEKMHAPEEALMINPQSRYETTGEFMLAETLMEQINQANDEETIVRRDGAVHVLIRTYTAEDVFYDLDLHLMEVNGSRIQFFSASEEPGYYRCEVEGACYYIYADEIYAQEANDPDAFMWTWESYIFPFGTLQSCAGMRQDDAGYTYLLLDCIDGMRMEYVLDGELNILENRLYSMADDGKWMLFARVTWEGVAAPLLPEVLLQRLADESSVSE